MKKFAIFTELGSNSNWNNRGDFNGFIEAETQDKAERIAYDYLECDCEVDCEDCDQDGDTCDGNCPEPECECSAWAVEVEMDVVMYDYNSEEYLTQRQIDAKEIREAKNELERIDRRQERIEKEISLAKNHSLYKVITEYENPLTFIDELKDYYEDRILKLKKRTRKGL